MVGQTGANNSSSGSGSDVLSCFAIISWLEIPSCLEPPPLFAPEDVSVVGSSGQGRGAEGQVHAHPHNRAAILTPLACKDYGPLDYVRIIKIVASFIAPALVSAAALPSSVGVWVSATDFCFFIRSSS